MQIEMAVYDETEYFRDSSDPLFNYPYADRKQIIGKYKLKFDANITNDVKFYMNNIKLYKSGVCLEQPFYTQLFFLKDLWDALYKEITKLYQVFVPAKPGPPPNPVDPDEANCKAKYFRKIKFNSNLE